MPTRSPHRQFFIISVICLAIVIIAAIAWSAKRTSDDASPRPLRIAAAASLQDAMPDLVAHFERDAGMAATFTVGSTGELARQIRAGAEIDVFLSADRQTIADLVRDGSADPNTVRSFASGTLVFVRLDSGTGAGAGPGPLTMESLSGPEIKVIALANPKTAPYGAAGRQAMRRAGVWPALEAKVVYAETIRQAMQFVLTGNADIGLIARSTLPRTRNGGKVQWSAVPSALYDPIIHDLAIMTRSAQAEEARRFVDWLTEPDGQGRRILRDFGFDSPPPP